MMDLINLELEELWKKIWWLLWNLDVISLSKFKISILIFRFKLDRVKSENRGKYINYDVVE
jgi:hypothetical protein